MMAQPSMPLAMPKLRKPDGINSSPAKTAVGFGAATPADSSDSGVVAAPLTSPAQFPGMFPSMPTSPMGPYEPTWYIIRAIHVHMIQRGYVAAAVAGAWLVLILAGRWRPGPSWIDRSGRVMGVLWVAPYLVYHADLSRLWS